MGVQRNGGECQGRREAKKKKRDWENREMKKGGKNTRCVDLMGEWVAISRRKRMGTRGGFKESARRSENEKATAAMGGIEEGLRT